MELFSQFFGCARFMYNQCVGWYYDASKTYKENKQNGIESPFPKLPLVTEYKSEYEFLKDCDNAALAYARKNFEIALSAYRKSYKGKRKGKKVGKPKFKKKGVCKYAYRTCDAHGGIRFNESNQIRLPKVGWVDVNMHRNYEGNIKAVTIEMTKDGKYYISVMCEVEQKHENNIKNIENINVVGIDMSFSDFIVDSEGTKAKYTRQYRNNEKRLKRMQKSMSRKEKESKNKEKERIKIAKLDRHIANCRMDFCHKLSKYYTTNYDVIVLENINLQDMAQSGLKGHGKSVNDLGFGKFKGYLKYKGEKYDCLIYIADKWFTSSKTCNHCGNVNSGLTLSDKEWICPCCGEVLDRDYNAACNLRDYFLNQINTVGTTGIQACGDNATTLREFLMQVLSMKQEAHSFREG